jgi:carbon-monoxide dehydrogenase small subunit
VLLDGLPVRSCLLLAVEVQGRQITTVEGLARDGTLHPIQDAFVEHHAIQCGFCTPGMILTAKALLDRNPRPTEADIRRAISGNVCRCTGYTKIVEAIESAARKG